MKRISILLITVFLAAFSMKAQELTNVTQYIFWARKLVSEDDHIAKVKLQIDSLQVKCDSLRSSWNQICMTYLGSTGKKYIDDLEYMIQNTDPAFDGQELYDALLNARDKAVERRTRRSQEPTSTPDPDKSGDGYLDERMLKDLK